MHSRPLHQSTARTRVRLPVSSLLRKKQVIVDKSQGPLSPSPLSDTGQFRSSVPHFCRPIFISLGNSQGIYVLRSYRTIFGYTSSVSDVPDGCTWRFTYVRKPTLLESNEYRTRKAPPCPPTICESNNSRSCPGRQESAVLGGVYKSVSYYTDTTII